jgi:hypothetical protein
VDRDENQWVLRRVAGQMDDFAGHRALQDHPVAEKRDGLGRLIRLADAWAGQDVGH